MSSFFRHLYCYKKTFYIFFCTAYKKLSSQTIEMKFNELSNSMSIELINGLRLYSFLMKKNIDNEKNLKIKTVEIVDSSIQNKEIAFSSDLPFGILSFTSYLDIKSMNIISPSVEIN